MKILMINYEFPPIGGGAGLAHYQLLKQYASYIGIEVDVLTSGIEPGLFCENYVPNIKIYKVGIHKNNLHYWRKKEVLEWLVKAGGHYRRLLNKNSYDLVHAFFGFPSGWLCYRTAKYIPYIISLRGSDVPGFNIRLGLDYKLFSGLFRRIWKSASVLVANSKGLQKLARDFMPEMEIQIIPNGVDTKRFYPGLNKEFTQPLKLLTVSRLIARKRIDLLIQSVAQLKNLGVKVQLTIAGGGPPQCELEWKRIQLGVSDQVTFLGRIPHEEMPQIYRNNDIFVMSSAHEGMSNAMLEAMASGLPIITTPCEGTDELITDNGIVVEHARAKDITEAIMILLNDRNICKAMSYAARKCAEQFSWSSVAQKYLDSYRKVIKKPKSAIFTENNA